MKFNSAIVAAVSAATFTQAKLDTVKEPSATEMANMTFGVAASFATHYVPPRPSSIATFATKTKKPKKSKTGSAHREIWTPIWPREEVLEGGFPWAGMDDCDRCWARQGVQPRPTYVDEYVKKARRNCAFVCPPWKLGTAKCRPSPRRCIGTARPLMGGDALDNTKIPPPWNTSRSETFPWRHVTPYLTNMDLATITEIARSSSAAPTPSSAEMDTSSVTETDDTSSVAEPTTRIPRDIRRAQTDNLSARATRAPRPVIQY